MPSECRTAVIHRARKAPFRLAFLKISFVPPAAAEMGPRPTGGTKFRGSMVRVLPRQDLAAFSDSRRYTGKPAEKRPRLSDLSARYGRREART